ncbi:PhzF family phenazine biosynthesis protein [Galbibacter sp. PAP.153]|uniref:PhzF family phenazine biosynthesis protein n=1 Tax=Galbibacter sp. PAP.153 TaxID=3104623 RepID=UPI00300BA10B
MKEKPVSISISNDVISMAQQPANIKTIVSSSEIAEALSVPEDKLQVKNLKPTVVKTEVVHLIVPLEGVETLNMSKPDKVLLKNLANTYGFQGVYCFSFIKNGMDIIAKTRFFNPGIGIDEDPATGSAAGPLIGLLHKKDIL